MTHTVGEGEDNTDKQTYFKTKRVPKIRAGTLF